MSNKQTLKDYYFDADGLMVFTKGYLLNRGFCCGNGCRHCPYEYENVPETIRATLINKQKLEIETSKNS